MLYAPGLCKITKRIVFLWWLINNFNATVSDNQNIMPTAGKHNRIYSICLTVIVTIMFVALSASSQQTVPSPLVRWNDEQADTLRLAAVYKTLCGSESKDKMQLTLLAARQFLGVPYVSGTLENPVEMLAINTSGLDCTTLVELSMALAKSVAEGGGDWRDALYALRDMRYRGGVVDGYASRLHYISDWITDNTYRKNIREVTSDAPRAKAQVTSVDFMTAHRDKYPQLAEQAVYDRIRTGRGACTVLKATTYLKRPSRHAR